MKLVISLITFILSLNLNAQVHMDVVPSFSYVQTGEISLRSTSRVTSGDIYGTRLNLLLQGRYDIFKAGIRLSHGSFGMRDVSPYDETAVDGRSFEYRVIHPYVGVEYKNVLLNFGIFIEDLGDITDSDNESYEIDEGIYISLGYRVKDFMVVSIDFENLEGYGMHYNSTWGMEYGQLDIENTLALNLSFPIEIL